MVDVTDPTALPFVPAPTPEEVLRGRVVHALREGGENPTVDPDGDVLLPVEDQVVFVRCVDSVPALVRVFGCWQVGDVPGGELVHLRAANAVTGAITLIKLTLAEDLLIVAAELIVNDATPLGPLVHGAVDAVLGAARTWYATVAEILGHPLPDLA